MQIYLLATNLFAIAALLVGLGGLPGRSRSRQLWPLFLLAISRSVILILALAAPESGQTFFEAVVSALEVFSTFCIVWILSGSISQLPAPWRNLARLGIATGVLLILLPLLPTWPVPPEIHSLIIAIFGPLLVLVTHGRVRWTYLLPLLILALANFLIAFDLLNLAWLLTLLAYALVIKAIHEETLQTYGQIYEDRYHLAETLTQDAISQAQEQRRWLEASKMISAVTDLNQSIEHIARSVAQITQVDQAVIFMLDTENIGQAQLATFYSPEGTFYITSEDELTFPLDKCTLLQEAIEQRQQLLLPQQNMNGLSSLYALWYENKAGPTLIQPLTVQDQPVGALVLGNPVSHRPIYESDARLCSGLATQMATMVEYRRRYLELESRAEAVALKVQSQSGSKSRQEELEKAAISARQSHELETYQAIFHSVSDGVVVSDQLGRVRWVNQAAEHILGKASQALIGQPIGTVYGQIDSREPIEDLVVAFSRRNQPLPTFIENEERAIQGRLIPWRNEEREWLGIIAVFRDVTREVKADRARNDFIGALSRELRSPLTTVKGYSELIINGAMDNYSAEQLRVQQIIHSSSERMVEVLDNAIQITAQNRYQILPRYEEIDLTEIIDAVLLDTASLARIRELTLQREIREELPRIAADPQQIRRILDNLLSNACRFTPPGGQVTVRAWSQSERVGNSRRPQVVLSVADNGVGIPPSELKRVFDPFYQVKDHILTEETGMGMGLAVVKELVQLHNGRVWVESVPGEGSVFYVVLPLTQDY